MTPPSDRPTILVLRALGLGDLLTGLPALAMLRAARPGHSIVLAAPRWLAPLVRLAGSVDDQVPAHELEPITNPPQSPELAVDLHGNGPESVQLLQACRPEHLVAFAAPDGPTWHPDEHEVSRWCRMVGEGLDLAAAPYPSVAGSIAVPSDVDVPTGATVLHCGAKSRARQWPPERFAELARRLAASGHDVIVTGAGAEAPIAHRIAADSGTRAATDLGLLELVALVADARLLVSGDTGASHVASAYRTPSVTMFGPVSPELWGPPAARRHQVLWHGTGGGDPHADRPDPALLRIAVDEVVDATMRAESSELVSASPADHRLR